MIAIAVDAQIALDHATVREVRSKAVEARAQREIAERGDADVPAVDFDARPGPRIQVTRMERAAPSTAGSVFATVGAG